MLRGATLHDIAQGGETRAHLQQFGSFTVASGLSISHSLISFRLLAIDLETKSLYHYNSPPSPHGAGLVIYSPITIPSHHSDIRFLSAPLINPAAITIATIYSPASPPHHKSPPTITLSALTAVSP